MSEENQNSEIYTITTGSWWDCPPRRKITKQSVYLRVDEIDGEWQVIVCGGQSKGPNLSYDHGYVDGFLIDSPGRYGLMNYVNETGQQYCYLAFRPLSGGERRIKFCWSPGSLQTYTHPKVFGRVPSRYATGVATAYCDGGYAADGTKTGPGCIAVNPKRFPYGTHLRVTWDGGQYDGVAHDTGGACMSGAIIVDLWFSNEQQCRNFGRRNVKVYY